MAANTEIEKLVVWLSRSPEASALARMVGNFERAFWIAEVESGSKAGRKEGPLKGQFWDPGAGAAAAVEGRTREEKSGIWGETFMAGGEKDSKIAPDTNVDGLELSEWSSAQV